MTWEEAKDQIAKEHSFDNFKECLGLLKIRPEIVLKYLDEAAKLYAREVADKAFDAGVARGIEEERYDTEGYIDGSIDKAEFMKQFDKI